MAIPDRPTVEGQEWPGQAPSPSYETAMTRVGRKGLNLVKAIDDLDPQELSRMSNVRSRQDGMLETRAGQTALATTTTGRLHSMVRLNDPAASSFTRLGGLGTTLYRGQSGALTLIDSGYSGDPLTFAAVSARLTGVPYVLIGDRTRNRKVARTGAVAPIGVSAPTIAATFGPTTYNQTSICRFDAADGSQASAWTRTAGTDTAGAATGVPTAADTGGAVVFTTNPTGAGAGLGYYSTVGIARSVDLTKLQGGLYTATDDDLMHFYINVDRPDRLEELRVYFVVSNVFAANVEPGTSATVNTDAYFKAFRPNDLTNYFDLRAVPDAHTVAEVGDAVRDQELREEFKIDRGVGDVPVEHPRAVPPPALEQAETRRGAIPALQLGRNVTTETGVVGYPLRRGDFKRIGNTAGRGWGTVTGLILVLRTNTNQAIAISGDGWEMTGGGGPDSTDPAARPYDIRYTNYDPLTGAESNPSPEQATTVWAEALRSPLTIIPWASGVSSYRQKFYRRGGTLNDDWYFDGMNASDGGTYITYRSDAEIAAEDTLQLDNYQPVPSTNSSGNSVLAQPVPIFFMVGEYCFALGDPNQPGRLYRSKRANVDAWPADEYEDVCPHSDELMNGCEWGGGGYVFSRSRLYTILLNSDGDWNAEPTGCTEGLVGRWAMTPTPYGIAFVSPFGVRLSKGSQAEPISDGWIAPLFRGETTRGMSPIDFTVPTALQLAYADAELWLTYQDTGGARRQLIYNFFDTTWRSYTFTTPVASVYSEPVQGAAPSLLLGGNTTGLIYTHSGFSDDGVAFAYAFRTGAHDLGDPRREKAFSEILLDAELQTATVTVQAHLNDEATAVTAQTVTGVAGLRRYSFEPFGTGPMRARNVAVDISGSAPTASRLGFNLLGVSRQVLPEITFNQPTPWEALPGGEGYVWGCFITCDTGNSSRTVLVEYTTNNGSITTAATLTVLADGRKKLPFTWSSVLAQQIRLRPTGSCAPWIRYKIEWFSDPEPPRVAGWDSNWENFGSPADKWLKGILLEADTFNVAKTVVLDADQSLAAVSLGSLTFNGRTVQHLSFAKVRGRLWRLRATDTNGGKLFRWQPIFDEEPLALSRWESQERPFPGMDGRWQKPLEAFVTIRCSGTVTWQITSYGVGSTALNTSSYTISTTSSNKRKIRVPLNAAKGLLFAHLFTASAAFWLYREESEVLVEDWASGEARWVPLFTANDDLDPPRAMGNAASAAATPGGA